MNFIYLDSVPMPVCPAELTTTINNRNETIDLVNGHEVNIVKKAGLTEISFELLIPAVRYPFAHYDGEFKTPTYYLAHFEKLKGDGLPFQFIVTRTRPNGDIFWDTNLTVTLEDYEVTETADEGGDVLIDVTLKQYRHFGTKKIVISEDGATVTVVGNSRMQTKGVPKTYTVKTGDTLWRICKTILGNEGKLDAVASANNIENPNDLTVGQVLNLDV